MKPSEVSPVDLAIGLEDLARRQRGLTATTGVLREAARRLRLSLPPTERYIDAGGYDLREGTRVRAYGDPEGVEPGVVASLTGPDGDVDDEGRPFGINPSVIVRWPDGSEETFSTSWTATGPYDEDAPYRCDDLQVAPDKRRA